MNLVVYALLPGLMLLLYGGLLSTYIHIAYQPDRRLETAAAHAGTVTLAVYAVWMILITLLQKQLPITNAGQVAAFLGFLIWADQSLVQFKVRQRMLSLLPIAAVTFLLLVGIVVGSRPEGIPRVVTGPWAAFHITLSLAGFAMLLGAGAYGAGYLILHRQMKSRKFGSLFSRLPSMEEINYLRTMAVSIGWLLITISLVSAAVWMLNFKPLSEIFHGHLAGMTGLWVIVSALALADHMLWGTQRRMATLTVGLTVFVLLLIVATVIGFFAGGAA
jgi:ABC-type uncharacterized transport system permease subunit